MTKAGRDSVNKGAEQSRHGHSLALSRKIKQSCVVYFEMKVKSERK